MRLTALSGVPFQMVAIGVCAPQMTQPPCKMPSVAVPEDCMAPDGCRSTQLAAVPRHNAACSPPNGKNRAPTCIPPRIAIPEEESAPGGWRSIRLPGELDQTEA